MMYLHSATGFHKHEYSPTPSSPQPRRSPLIRAALSSPVPRLATSPVLQSSVLQPSVIQPLAPQPRRARSASTKSARDKAVTFMDPEPEAEDGGYTSSESTVLSVTSTGSRRRKRRSRMPRMVTTFHFAHPAPTRVTKSTVNSNRRSLLQIRPKILMQLQKLSADSRPTPTLDVLPTAKVVLPTLAKSKFRGRGDLGVNDVMIVSSEDYDAPEEDDTDSSDCGVRDRVIIAVICQIRNENLGRAEICLDDGSVWDATPMPNGMYDFTTVDENDNKKTARWVRRPVTAKLDDPHAPLYKHTFSMVNPNSRRHPIMGTLTHSTLDIPDYYTTVSATARRYPPSRPIPTSAGGETLPEDENEERERTQQPIDDEMKILIQVTAVWVALREGRSPYFHYDDSAIVSPTTCTSPPLSGNRSRAASLMSDTNNGAGPEVRPTSPDNLSPCSNTIGGKILRSASKRRSTGVASPPLDPTATPRRRASSGTAFMQRAAARRNGTSPNPGSPLNNNSSPERESEFSQTPLSSKRASMPAGRLEVANLTSALGAFGTYPDIREPQGEGRTRPQSMQPSPRRQSKRHSRIKTADASELASNSTNSVQGDRERERRRFGFGGRLRLFLNLFRPRPHNNAD